MPVAEVDVAPAGGVEHDVGAVLDASRGSEGSVFGSLPEGADERAEEAVRPGRELAAFGRPVEDLIRDGEEVEVPVGDLEQRLDRRLELLPAGPRRVEDGPEGLEEVVGEPLQQPRDEGLLRHSLTPQRDAGAVRPIGHALEETGRRTRAPSGPPRSRPGAPRPWGEAYRLRRCNIYVSLPWSVERCGRGGAMRTNEGTSVLLELTTGEVEALDAVRVGVGALAERPSTGSRP